MPHSRRTGGNRPAILVFEVNFLANKVFGNGRILRQEKHSSKSEVKKEEFFGH
jgi:hypothetical protein